MFAGLNWAQGFRVFQHQQNFNRFIALGGAFWSFDGWGNISYVGGEIENSQKNIPRAILLGVGIVIIIYLLINFSYLYVLTLNEIANAPGDRVASAVMSTVLGSRGATIIAALVLLSTFDTVNSSILTNARVYFAMARDKLFWKPAGAIHPTYNTPATALWLQGAWSIILLVSGSFDLITSMYVFVNWLFYLLIPISLFVLRKRSFNESPKVYKVPLYPYIPACFALFTLIYLIQTLISDIQAYQTHAQPCIKSLMGFSLVLMGSPFYLLIKNKKGPSS